MRKLISYLSIALLTVFLVSCETEARYKLMYDLSDICGIEIIEVGEENAQGSIQQTTVCVINDITAFMNDFTQLTCYYLYTDPVGIENNSTVIKIIYNNNDYELISASGQARCINGQYNNYVGCRYFDKEQYEALISKYSNQLKYQTELSHKL